jgi:hypothetical protein
VTYTPAAGFSGADAFTFRALDGSLASAPASVSITVAAPPDTTAPSCKRSGSSTLSVKKLVVTFKCGENATLSLKLTLPRSVAKKLKIAASKTVTIASGKGTASANVSKKITLKLTSKAKKRLSKLSKAKLKKLRPTLTVTATDVAGNKKSTTAKLKLKR